MKSTIVEALIGFKWSFSWLSYQIIEIRNENAAKQWPEHVLDLVVQGSSIETNHM
jgi:hypothetical protein